MDKPSESNNDVPLALSKNDLTGVNQAPISAMTFPKALKKKNEVSEAESVPDLLRRLEREKQDALAELKERYRSVSNNMKGQYDRMKKRLQLAVNKGREVVLRNQELEGQLQELERQLQYSMNANSELIEKLTQQKETLQSQHITNMENLKQKLLEVSNEKKHKEDVIDQILKEQALSQNVSVSVTGPCVNSVPLQAVLENYDKPVQYQWYRAAHAKFVPIPGATESSYTPTADDIGTTLRITCTANESNVKCSREVGPVQIEKNIEANLCAFLQKLKQNGPFFEQKVLQENNEPLYIRITCDKVKIRNEKITLEKEEFNDHLMITLSDEDPLKFTLRISASSKHTVHQFRVGKVKQREIVTLLLRTMYMRSLVTKMENQRQAVRLLVLASSLKARLVLDPYTSSADGDSNNQILKALQSLTSNSSLLQTYDVDSQKIRIGGHRRERSNGQDSVQTLNSIQTVDIFEMNSKSPRPMNSGPNSTLETAIAISEQSFLHEFDVNPNPTPNERASSTQEFESDNDNSSVDTKNSSKPMVGLTILDSKVVSEPTDDAFQTFQICPPSNSKSTKKITHSTKKRKRKILVHPILCESWTLKINDRHLTESRCTGEIKLCFQPPPRKQRQCGLQLRKFNHLERINCNPELVKKNSQKGSYDITVDREVSELVAMKYTIFQQLLEQRVPLKAQAIWDIKEKESKITLRWRMNPANQLELSNVVFEVQLSHSSAIIKDSGSNDPSVNVECSLEMHRLRLTLLQPLPPNLDRTIDITIVLATEEKLTANPFQLTFQSAGHFTPELEVLLLNPEGRWVLKDLTRSSLVALEIF